LLISHTFLFLLLQLKLKSVDVLAKSEKHVRFLLDVFLSAENFLFAAIHLLADAADFNLALVCRAILVSHFELVLVELMLQPV